MHNRLQVGMETLLMWLSSLIFLPLWVLFIQEVPQVGVDFIWEGTQLPTEENIENLALPSLRYVT